MLTGDSVEGPSWECEVVVVSRGFLWAPARRAWPHSSMVTMEAVINFKLERARHEEKRAFNIIDGEMLSRNTRHPRKVFICARVQSSYFKVCARSRYTDRIEYLCPPVVCCGLTVSVARSTKTTSELTKLVLRSRRPPSRAIGPFQAQRAQVVP